MDGKFLGLGLTNIILIWMIFIALTVIAKTVLNQYEVPGLTMVINAV